MADDRFKKYQTAGAEFLEEARLRAEEFLRELAKLGETTQKSAQDAVDDLVEGSRKGTEQILAFISKEITVQLSQLGLTSREDLEALIRRVTGQEGRAGKEGGPRQEGRAGEEGVSEEGVSEEGGRR